MTTTSALNLQRDLSVSPKAEAEPYLFAKEVALAHKHRLSITKPRQSSFRVVALLYYKCKTNNNATTNKSKCNRSINADKSIDQPHSQNEEQFVIGANDEPCYIGGSICAERAAMLQLRFRPDIERITKIVIVTDADHEISPGLLCREFMASSNLIPRDTPIILGGNCCKICGIAFEDVLKGGEYLQKCSGRINSNGGDYENKNNNKHHDFMYVITNINEIYPHPSPFLRKPLKDHLSFGESFSRERTSSNDHNVTSSTVNHMNFSKTVIGNNDSDAKNNKNSLHSKQRQYNIADPLEKENLYLRLQHLAILELQYDYRMNVHPIQYGAAVYFDDGSIAVAHQKKGLEYGCTLDAVSQLAQCLQEKCHPTYTKEDCDGVGSGAIMKRECCKPLVLVQVDQFGIAHAPFAPGRAFFAEHGYGDCIVLVHDESCKDMLEVSINDLTPGLPKMEDGILVDA